MISISMQRLSSAIVSMVTLSLFGPKIPDLISEGIGILFAALSYFQGKWFGESLESMSKKSEKLVLSREASFWLLCPCYQVSVMHLTINLLRIFSISFNIFCSNFIYLFLRALSHIIRFHLYVWVYVAIGTMVQLVSRDMIITYSICFTTIVWCPNMAMQSVEYTIFSRGSKM